LKSKGLIIQASVAEDFSLQLLLDCINLAMGSQKGRP